MAVPSIACDDVAALEQAGPTPFRSPPPGACPSRTRRRRGARCRRSPCTRSSQATPAFRRRNHSRPSAMMPGTLASVSTLSTGAGVSSCGSTPRGTAARRRGRDGGHRPPPAGRSPRREVLVGPAHDIDGDVRGDAGRHHLGDRRAQPLDLGRERSLDRHDHARAVIAYAATSAPSSTRYGLRRIFPRSLNVPGSPSAALTTTVTGAVPAAFAATVRHLSPVGKPAPPRPRRPAAATKADDVAGANCAAVASARPPPTVRSRRTDAPARRRAPGSALPWGSSTPRRVTSIGVVSAAEALGTMRSAGEPSRGSRRPNPTIHMEASWPERATRRRAASRKPSAP